MFPAQWGAATSYIAANFNNTTGTDTISNWLLTPPVTLQNGATMSFWTRTVDVPDVPGSVAGAHEHQRSEFERGDDSDRRGRLHDAAVGHQPDLHDDGLPECVDTVHGDGERSTIADHVDGWPSATLWRTADRTERTPITLGSIRSSSLALAAEELRPQLRQRQPQRREHRWLHLRHVDGDANSDSDSDRRWDAVRTALERELRRSNRTSVAGGMGGDQCAGSSAAVGDLDDDA